MAEELVLTEDEIEQIPQWQKGKTYKLELTVEQITPSMEGEARFRVKSATGRPASRQERDDSQEEGPSFRDLLENNAQEMESDVLPPSNTSARNRGY